MRSPFLSTQYVDKDDSISCKGRQVGRRVHYKLVVGRGSVQRRQPNVYIDNNFNIPHHTVHYKQKGDMNAHSILYKLKLHFHWNSASLYPEINVHMCAYNLDTLIIISPKIDAPYQWIRLLGLVPSNLAYRLL